MFIRAVSTRDRKTGSVYTTHHLVESIRTERGPRQRVIMFLGTLDLPREQWRALAAVLEERLGGQRNLFPADPALASLADSAFASHDVKESLRHAKATREATSELVTVDLASLTTSIHRSLGQELVGSAFFDRLGFPELLSSCGMTAYQQDLARAVIVGRLLKPGSDLATWRWIRNSSSLPEFVESDLENVGKDGIYEIADRLWLHKETLEAGLRKREGQLFPSGENIILYDLTNAHFEGRCLGNKLAKRGVSKQKRMDCPLVTLALAVDAQGFPLFSQIYEGNQSEPATLKDLLARMELEAGGLFEGQKPTLTMDRGIATADNLAYLESEGYPYLVIERRDAAKDFESVFEQAPNGFQQISGEKEGTRVYIKKMEPEAKNTPPAAESTDPNAANPPVPTALLLCYSEGRMEKERGIDSLKEKRWLEDLERLNKSIAKGNLKASDKVHRRIGRLLERYPSVASQYSIEAILEAKPESTDASPKRKREVEQRVESLTWKRLPERQARETRQGCYVIRTTHINMEPERIWRLYMALTRVESAFRALKSDLGFRPIRHHGDQRTKGHLFVSVLAYHLLISIERSLLNKGDHRSWTTLQEQLQTHQRSTVNLRGKGNLLYQIRVSATPEPLHREIYRLLEIQDPLPRTRRDLTMQT
jgi:transposase